MHGKRGVMIVRIGVKISPAQRDAHQGRIEVKRDFLLTAGLTVCQPGILFGVPKQELNLKTDGVISVNERSA